MDEEKRPLDEFLAAAEGLEWLKNMAEHATNESDSRLLYEAADDGFYKYVLPLGAHPDVKDHYASIGSYLLGRMEQAEQRWRAGKTTCSELEAEQRLIALDRRFQRVALYAILFTDAAERLLEPNEVPVSIRAKSPSEYKAERESARGRREAKEREQWPVMRLDPESILSFSGVGIELEQAERLILEGLAKKPGEFMSQAEFFPKDGYRPTQKSRNTRTEYLRLATESLNAKLSFLPAHAQVETQNPGTRWKKYRLANAKIELGQLPDDIRRIDTEIEKWHRLIQKDNEEISVSIWSQETTISQGAFRLLAIVDRIGGPISLDTLRAKMYGRNVISDQEERQLTTHMFEAADKSWGLFEIIALDETSGIWLKQEIKQWRAGDGASQRLSTGTSARAQLRLNLIDKLDIKLAPHRRRPKRSA